MNAAPLLAKLSDRVQLKSYALELLAASAPESGTAPPLPVLLFLLDGVVFLRSAGALGAKLRAARRGRNGHGIDGGDEADVEDEAAASGQRALTADAAADDALESQEEWGAYIAEMYLHPPAENAAASPLYIPADVLPMLPTMCLSDEYTTTSHELLVTACTAALGHLSPTPAQDALDALLDLPPSAFPSLFSSSILSTIATTLASYRQSRVEPPTMTFRSVVATTLHHLCGCGELDAREGIDRMFPASESPLIGGQDHDGEIEASGLRRSLLRGAEDPVREANLSILRRDDKLRWIFGDNFQQRASTTSSQTSTLVPHSSSPQRSLTFAAHTISLSATPAVLSTPTDHPRPASMSSFESLASAFSQTQSSTTSRPHRRVHSTSSSIAPLLPMRSRDLPANHTASPVPFANFAPSSYTFPRPNSPPPFTSPTSMPTYRRSQSSSSSPSPPSSLSRDTLSRHARRELVRKSKKLNKMFGVPLEERAAEEVLVRPTPRRYSFPPGSPTSPRRTPFADEPESSGMGRSNSSPVSMMFPTGSLRDARGSVTDDEPASAREERRRKLDKVQRLLGERVPAGLVLANHPPSEEAVGGTGMQRGNSRLGGIWKGLGFGGRKREGTGEAEGEMDVITRGEEMPDATPVMIPAGKVVSSVRKDATPVQELARSRKMEQVFGTLPPTSMYSSAHHQRSISSPVDKSFSRDARPTSITSLSTIDSYRNSIASLRYLAETDPSALDDIARVYAHDGRLPHSAHRASTSTAKPSLPDPKWDEDSTSPNEGPLEITDSDRELESRYLSGVTSDAGSAFEPDDLRVELGSESSPEDLDVGRPAKDRRRSTTGRKSTDKRRTVRKAQKLASFFGTTRGEVWTMLLDDLEAAIVDEDGVDDDERAEVLDCVSRLRRL